MESGGKGHIRNLDTIPYYTILNNTILYYTIPYHTIGGHGGVDGVKTG